MCAFKLTTYTLLILLTTLGLCGCNEINELRQSPKETVFYSETAPPPVQEFRWSNGDLPKTFDPILAAAAPETDVARAIYDGLTDLDETQKHAIPATAVHWETSEDFRTWTFYLRDNVKWSNGKPLTANDFVRSWRRFAELDENIPHHELLRNIVGAGKVKTPKFKVQILDSIIGTSGFTNKNGNLESVDSNPESANPLLKAQTSKPEVQNTNSKIDESRNPKSGIQSPESWFGAEAVNDSTLRVWLIEPDENFPKLVSHPSFRPIYDKSNFDKPTDLVTNGAFRLTSFNKNGVVLERDKNYWNAKNVKLERVRFVPVKNADAALNAYRAGEIDAVTNANFEPLATKLMTSYKDFRRSTHNALTFYEFNTTRKPFTDHRVREALTIAIDRERLTKDELDGASVAANHFLPNSNLSEAKVFNFDPNRAKTLLSEAGFADGKDFPKIRLVINRNDSQRKIARAVADMWRKTLGIETEIITKEPNEMDATSATKDFDLLRRGEVLPTTDDAINLLMLFDSENESAEKTPEISSDAVQSSPNQQNTNSYLGRNANSFYEVMPESLRQEKLKNESQTENLSETIETPPILTESQAVAEIPAIPLYFPTSNALVKPYVKGFEPSLLDAPSLKTVEIQIDWK
ncbi:MAG: peptide ABC transporter substrate-binding protein [Pyrinomonadaceae bacterium]|nr:peptide ABC transporter substrate-binding protein [Pyrinomonadaceae bacterium]